MNSNEGVPAATLVYDGFGIFLGGHLLPIHIGYLFICLIIKGKNNLMPTSASVIDWSHRMYPEFSPTKKNASCPDPLRKPAFVVNTKNRHVAKRDDF